MNKHDEQRKRDLIRTLVKAKDQAEIACAYLDVNEVNPEEAVNANLVLAHIDTALEQLGATVQS